MHSTLPLKEVYVTVYDFFFHDDDNVENLIYIPLKFPSNISCSVDDRHQWAIISYRKAEHLFRHGGLNWQKCSYCNWEKLFLLIKIVKCSMLPSRVVLSSQHTGGGAMSLHPPVLPPCPLCCPVTPGIASFRRNQNAREGMGKVCGFFCASACSPLPMPLLLSNLNNDSCQWNILKCHSGVVGLPGLEFSNHS